MAGLIGNWQQNRRNRRKNPNAKRGVIIENARNAGINMGRDDLRKGVAEILRNWWPDNESVDGGTYIEIYRTHTLEDLDDAKERVMRKPPPLFVVVIGGDGTTQRALGEDEKFLAYLYSDPRHTPEVIVVKAGSQVVIPQALGLLGDDPLRAFDVVCEKYVRGVPRDIVCAPILEVNQRRGFICGAGVVVNSLDRYHDLEPGPGRALKAGLSVFLSETLGRLNPWRKPSAFRRFDATACWRDAHGAEQRVDQTRFNAFVASSIREINPWLKITHRTGERLGCFHALGLNNGFFRSMLNLPAMIVGAPMGGAVHDMVTDRLVITYAESMRHTIDGEIYTIDQLGRAPGVADEIADRTVVIQTGPYIKFVVA